MKKLLLHILSQIDEPAALALASADELEMLVNNIHRCLENRRYLTVIHDIQDLLPCTLWSWLVITTRIRSIAGGWQKFKDEDLSLICNSGMFLLKHFSLRNTSVSRLPPEIKKLVVFHMLVASHTQIRELPSEVKKHTNKSATKISLIGLKKHINKAATGADLEGHLRTLLVGGEGVKSNPTIVEVPEGVKFPSHVTTLKSEDC